MQKQNYTPIVYIPALNPNDIKTIAYKLSYRLHLDTPVYCYNSDFLQSLKNYILTNPCSFFKKVKLPIFEKSIKLYPKSVKTDIRQKSSNTYDSSARFQGTNVVCSYGDNCPKILIKDLETKCELEFYFEPEERSFIVIPAISECRSFLVIKIIYNDTTYDIEVFDLLSIINIEKILRARHINSLQTS